MFKGLYFNKNLKLIFPSLFFSDFSEIAVFHTSGTTPPTPSPPKLKEAGIYNMTLEWCAPTNTNPNDSLTYVLEMEEAGSVSFLFICFNLRFQSQVHFICMLH